MLKELDRTQPFALGDRAALAFAFEALLARALAWVPERGDLYLASKAVAAGLRGEPSVRVDAALPPPRRTPFGHGARRRVPADRELALDIVLAELAVRAQGGSLRIDATDAEETVIAVDLPAAPDGSAILRGSCRVCSWWTTRRGSASRCACSSTESARSRPRRAPTRRSRASPRRGPT